MGSAVSAVMVTLAAVVAGIGIALIFAPMIFAGAAVWLTASLCVLGGGLLTGSLYAGYEALFNPNVSWGLFGKEFLKGFVVGCVSSVCSLAASAITLPLAASLGVSSYAVAATLGGLCGLATNGVSNLMKNRNFFDNWKLALFAGAGIGLICHALQLGFSDEAVGMLQSIRDRLLDHLDEGTRAFIAGINWTAIGNALRNVRLNATLTSCLHQVKQELVALFAFWRQNNQETETEEPLRQPRPTSNRPRTTRRPVPDEIPATSPPSSPPPPYSANEPSLEENKAPQFDETILTDVDEADLLPGNAEEEIDDWHPVDVEEVDNINGDDSLLTDDVDNLAEEIGGLEIDDDIGIVDLGAAEAPSRDDSIQDLTPPENADNLEELQVKHTLRAAEAQPTGFIQMELREEEVPDPAPAAAVQSTSSDSPDPDSGGSNVNSTPVLRRLPQVEQIRLPVEVSTACHEKHGSSPRNSKGIRAQIKEAYQNKFHAAECDDNTFIGSKYDLLTLHEKHEKLSTEANRKVHVHSNYMFATTSGSGMQLGGGQGSHSPSPSNQENNKSADKKKDGGKDKGKQQSNRMGSFKPFKKQVIVKNGKKTATVHKLITADENNNYKLTDKGEEWPEFKGKMRVIGLMGAPGSGKTTLAQAILLQMGYTISEMQATFTRIPMGIHAYVLHDDNLIIVECCEGIDPKESSQSKSPYAALLLELFMYLFCTKIVYVIPYSTNKTYELKEYARNRLSMLMTAAAAHKAIRPQEIAFVLRVFEAEKDYKAALKELKYYFTQPQRRYDQKGQITLPLTDEELQMDEIQALHGVTVNPVRKFEQNDNLLQREEYDKQLQNVIGIMRSEDGTYQPDPEFIINNQPLNCPRFCSTLKKIWAMLSESKCLEGTLANIRADEVQNSEEDPYGVKKFYENVHSFIIKVQKARLNDIVQEYERFVEKMKQKGEEFKKLPKEEQTPQIFVESVVKLADIILRKSLDIEDSKLKEEGIRIGLHGFVILVKAGNNTVVEVMALRMAVFDCSVVEVLKRSEIYNLYPNCWFLLTRLARSGFRLPVLEFDVWKAASDHLAKDSLTTDSETWIYLHILSLLEELTDADPSRCVPSLVRHTDTYFSRNISIEQIAFNYEKEKKDDVFDMLTTVLRKPNTAQSVYQDWLELPETWFNESEYARVEFDSEEHRRNNVEKVMGTLISRNFEILYRQIAETFSKDVVKRSSEFITRKFGDRNEEIEKTRLLLWKNIIGNAEQNKEIYSSMIRTNLLEFLIQEYIQGGERPATYPQALNTLGAMVWTDACYKDDKDVQEYIREKCTPTRQNNSSNVHTFADIDQRNHRWEFTQWWTLARLRCLESGVVEQLIPYFCEREHPQGIQYLLSALVTFLANGRNEEETRLSEKLYITKRHALLRRIAVEMILSAEKIKNMKKGNQEVNETNYKYQTNMAVLRIGCHFVNYIMAIYYSDKSRTKDEKFFDDGSKTFNMLVSAAGELYPICKASSYSTGRGHKLAELKLHYFNFVLNLASVSQQGICGILKKYNISNIGELSSVPDPIQVTHKEEEFLKLDMNTNYKSHHKLVVVAADLLFSTGELTDCFVIIKDTLTIQMKRLQRDLEGWKQERENYKNWIRDENCRSERKNIEAKKVTTFVSMSMPVIASISCTVKYAIEDVPYWSPLYEHCWMGKPSYEDIKRVYGQNVQEAILDAYALFILNNVNQKADDFEKVLRFFGRLAESDDKPFTLRKGNPNVTKMCEFLHFEAALVKCGYSWQESEGKYVTDNKKYKSHYAVLFYDELRSLKEMNVCLLLDSRFNKVTAACDLEKERLPLSFFASNHEDYDFHSTLPIKELLKRRPYRKRVPFQLRYTLIRVAHRDNGDCYQAVFTPEARVSDVLQQLRSCGLGDLYKENVGDLDGGKQLREIGGFVIELKAH